MNKQLNTDNSVDQHHPLLWMAVQVVTFLGWQLNAFLNYQRYVVVCNSYFIQLGWCYLCLYWISNSSTFFYSVIHTCFIPLTTGSYGNSNSCSALSHYCPLPASITLMNTRNRKYLTFDLHCQVCIKKKQPKEHSLLIAVLATN